MVILGGADIDLVTLTLSAVGFVGACVVGGGFINAWRTPMLTIHARALSVPTFLGHRDIAIKPNHPVGEYLASSIRSNRKSGTIEGNKFVHFYTLDGDGVLTELVALHRDAPEIAGIRRAFGDIAGLTVETLKVDPNSSPQGPDIAHWKQR
jgi:hypothetical protein